MYNEEKEILNLNVEGKEVVVRHGEAPRVFEYQGFQHEVYSTDSFVRLVKEKSSQPNCVVAYNDDKIIAILNDNVIERIQDHVVYAFRKSLQYDEWKEVLTRCTIFDQKTLIKFLQRREPDEVIDMEMFLAMLQNFKYVTNIEADFSRADDQNYTFAIKVGEQEGSIKIPQMIYLNLEIFNESQFTQEIEIEVEVYKPKEAGEKTGFKLTCPKLQRYLKAAVDHEIEELKKGLKNYLIVTGDI